MTTTTHLYEMQFSNYFQWLPIVSGSIFSFLEARGFRHSEILEHIADMDTGHVITSEDGTKYRAARVKVTLQYGPETITFDVRANELTEARQQDGSVHRYLDSNSVDYVTEQVTHALRGLVPSYLERKI